MGEQIVRTETIPLKPIEIFCGTGGVGKTTLATSRALYLGLQGKKVLLITIDPAKRLKQVLNLDDKKEGDIQKVSLSDISPSPQDTTTQHKTIDALLMSPLATLKRLAKQNTSLKNPLEHFENPILNILARPTSGMNEILAIVEVQHRLKSQEYDTIILDTPPGKHFIDFLQSSQKIKKFFDKSFIDIFHYLGKTSEAKPTKFMTKFFSKGIKKLLSYLEVVTGPDFVEVFIDAITILYQNKEGFLEALDFQNSLQQKEFSNWFLVTSVDQDKLQDAGAFKGQAIEFMHGDSFLVVNKSLLQAIETWTPQSKDLIEFKNSMLKKEDNIRNFASQSFDNVLYFPEISNTSPLSHVKQLSSAWERR